MHLHRLSTVAIAAGTLVACAPSIEKHQNPASTDYVLFDPSVSQLPLPNDLALSSTAIAAATGAQKELLLSFAAQGGFPNDQEVPITVDVQRFTYGGSEPQKGPPPVPVDTKTAVVNAPGGAATVALFELKVGAATATPVDPTTVTISYVQSADRGTITIQNNRHAVTLSQGNVIQSRRWNAGSRYIVLLRGGATGVRLQGGGELTPMPTLFLITRGVDLSLPQNEYLLPGDGRAGRAATGAQLEQLRQSYIKAGVFGSPQSLAEQVFGAGGTQELISVQTFQIAPLKPGAAVVTDASAGVVPLPSDLLLDPTTNKIVNNPAFGPLASGIATLDGFSTTAMELTQTSAPVVAASVNAGTVFLYDLSNPAQPTRVKELEETLATAGVGAGFVAEPFQMTVNAVGAPCAITDNPSGCFSTAIGLQPAVPIPLPAPLAGKFTALPPLKEGTEYAVLLTDGVKDTAGAGLQGSTLSRILLFQNPLVDASGKSQVPGQSDATAAGLEKIRLGVAAADKALQAEGIAKGQVVLGYTFRTQTITQVALQLAAAPYQHASQFVPAASSDITTDFVASVGGSLPGVAKVFSVTVPTLNPIDPATGALNPDNTKWAPTTLTALVLAPAPKQGAPLVVFQHGLGRSKSDVAAIASSLAAAGFVTAAIDAPLHGDRSYCVADSECVCPGGGSACAPKCNLFPTAPGATVNVQGDAASGVCSTGSVPGGLSVTSLPVSGRFVVTTNLFRTRDALRQDILDTSALVLALAPTTAPSNPFATQLAAAGVTIDPTKVYWIGQSWGGILGTLNTAANPRISRSVLNVPGGTLADVFTSPQSQLSAALPGLLAPLGITVGTPQYLQFVQVVKLILDAGDPVNFARHLTGDADHPTLPDLLASKPNQAAKSVLGQVAIGDATIPNPFNFELLGNVFTGPFPASAAPSNVVTYSGTGVSHGFLLGTPTPGTAPGAAQADAAAFLGAGTLPAVANQIF